MDERKLAPDGQRTGPAAHASSREPVGQAKPADRRLPVNVSSRRRLVLLYLIAAAIIISLGGRLYYLQVMNTTSFSKQAEQNQTRNVIVPAVRGQILDDVGHQLITNRTALVVSVDMMTLSQQPGGAEDLAADRGHDHVPGLVLLGLLGERGGVHHLDVVEPAAQRDQQGCRDQVEQRETAARRYVHR
jgi:hypothetical protein